MWQLQLYTYIRGLATSVECVPYNSQRECLDYLKQVLPVDAFEAFMHHRVFVKTVFCLEEKQGMIVNDDNIYMYSGIID